MLIYPLDKRDKTTVFQFLYLCIKNDIISGKLKTGDKLPSKRMMAQTNNISVVTVENAYNQLISEGYIYSREKVGYFVSDTSFDTAITRQFPVSPVQSTEVEDIESYIADFTSHRISAKVFPFAIWSKLMRQVLSSRQSDLLKVSPGQGIPELRHAIAKHLSEYRGIAISPDQIIVGSGTDYLYGLIVQLLGQDQIYAVEDPGYTKIAMVYRSHGAICTPIKLDDQGIEVQQLNKKNASVVHISPAHHFPTGLVMPYTRRLELLNWASKNPSRYIIEDDYDSELRLTGKPIPALMSIDSTERVIYMNTFSKTLSSTIRISYMVLPCSLLIKFRDLLSFYSCTVSNHEQYTLAAFIERGYFDKHIHRVRKQYRSKREKILEMFSTEPISRIATIEQKDAGFHFIIHFHTCYSESQIVAKAKSFGVKITPLSNYYFTSSDFTKGRFVIDYSSIDENCIMPAVNALYEALKNDP